jgi:hypothetical protein
MDKLRPFLKSVDTGPTTTTIQVDSYFVFRHIFAIGNAAYYQMLKDGINQVVVIRYTVVIHRETGNGYCKVYNLLYAY